LVQDRSERSAKVTKLVTLVTLVLSLALASLGAPATAYAGNPFDELKGDWKGGGTVVTKNDPARKVTCDVTYQVAGSNLTQKMHCTGDDYEIEATLKLTDKNGKIKGSWNEVIYDASGGVTGNVKDDIIRAVIRGDKFSGRMSLRVTDAGHSINIVQRDDKTGIYKLVTSLFLRR
jgi:hypothetical protein